MGLGEIEFVSGLSGVQTSLRWKYADETGEHLDIWTESSQEDFKAFK
jgi:hypothetical protein